MFGQDKNVKSIRWTRKLSLSDFRTSLKNRISKIGRNPIFVHFVARKLWWALGGCQLVKSCPKGMVEPMTAVHINLNKLLPPALNGSDVSAAPVPARWLNSPNICARLELRHNHGLEAHPKQIRPPIPVCSSWTAKLAPAPKRPIMPSALNFPPFTA
jgi:hypothetical protein